MKPSSSLAITRRRACGAVCGVVLLALSAAPALADPLNITDTALTGTADADTITNTNSRTADASHTITDTNDYHPLTTSAAGIDGLAGDDTLANAASVTSTSTATVEIPLKYSSTEATAESVGVAGGEGQDTLRNYSLITAIATGRSVITELLMQIDIGVTGWPTEATATAIGMDGGTGADSLRNTSWVEARGIAYSQADKIRIDSVNIPADLLGAGDARTVATAEAIGLDAGAETSEATLDGVESINNGGLITAYASSTASTQQQIIELIGAARLDDRTTADATATGIAGGERDNHIENTGDLDVDANAHAELLSGELKMKGLMIKGAMDLFGVDVGQFQTIATAGATGIAGGGGNDTITSLNADDTVDVYADADALSVAVTLTVSPPTGGGGESVSLAPFGVMTAAASEDATGELPSYGDADTQAIATAAGMSGGAGDDTIESAAVVSAVADATASSIGIALDASFSAGASYFPIPGAAIVDASTDAHATTVGLDGGQGTDTLTNGGTLNATALSDAQTVTVGVTAKGVTKGFAGGVTVADSSSNAVATSVGMAGGDGTDSLTNTGMLVASSTATDDATTIDVTVAASTEGLVGAVTLVDSSATATAVSTGMSGEAGSGTLTNTGSVVSSANADTQAVTVGVSISGTKVGVTTGVTVSDASSEAEGTATGLSARSGGNTIISEGAVSSTAVAHDDSSSIAVTIAGEKAGIVAGVVLADATATATATAVGIDSLDDSVSSGAPGDTIITSGGVTANATATATEVAVAATLSAALQGVVGGVAAVQGDGTSEACAVGVRTGIGDDTVTNADGSSGGVSATSVATTTSTNVSATLNAAWEGVALGATVADTTTNATAEAAGIATGDGGDTIVNDATLVSSATATASSTTVAVTVAVAPKGVSAGFALSTAETQSEATATGIDSGAGDDRIQSNADLDIDATATTRTKNITINFAEMGAAIADVSSTATATATGVDLGEGNDQFGNTAAVDATAIAKTDDTGGTANFAGHASGDVTSTARATAVGITNAADADDVDAFETISNDHDGLVSAYAEATVDADNYVVQGGGAAFADTGAIGDASAIAIAGDVGAEHITNSGLVSATADTTADATSFAFDLVGVQLGSAGVNATGSAVGIDGSAGANRITNSSTGAIHAYSTVDTLAGSVTGGFGLNVAVSGVTADARSAGIWTEDDDDWIVNAGLLDVTGAVYGNAGAGSIGLFALTMSYSLGNLTLDGIRAGGGNDYIENTGWLNVGQLRVGDTALVKADSEAVSMDLFGLVTSALSARGTVTGIAGGVGEDTIMNGGILTIGDDDQWMAIGEALGESGQIAGWNSAHAGSTATLTATGIDGGLDLDTIVNGEDGMITVDARSYASVQTTAYLTLGFLGGITAKSSAYANAYATGIAGGAGSDLLGNVGAVLARATSYGYSDSYANIWLDFAATANAKSNVDSTAEATGIAAGTGINSVENSGSVSAQANAYARGYGNSEAWFEDTETQLDIRSVAKATGIAGGDDGNTVLNRPDGQITAAATASTSDPTWLLASTAYSDKTATASAGSLALPVLADATGIALGVGDDVVQNDGDMTVTAYSAATVHVKTDVWYRYPTSTATAVAVGDATGIDAGAGSNVVVNNGGLRVTATSNATPSVDSWSRDYRATASTTANSTASATGIASDGNLLNLRDGEILVTARAISKAKADTSAENVTAEASLKASAVGMTVATDAAAETPHQLRNDGGVSVLATAGEDASGDVYESAYINTNVWVRDDNGSADVDLNAAAVGIQVHGAPTEITNTGQVLVQARARPYARSFVDSRDYNPDADAVATGVTYARGIHATDGEHWITNTGSMDVRAMVRDAYTQADTWSSWSSCYSTATTTVSAHAGGIVTAAGADDIVNDGRLTVLADTDAVSYAYADTRDNNLADEYESSHVSALSEAVGIDAGAGANTVFNHDMIDVYAIARPQAWWGGGHASVTWSEAGQAHATGIRVGDGGSLIHNTGTITARSAADGRTSDITSAVGIAGGSGGDTIINEGTIAAYTYSSALALRDMVPPPPDLSGALVGPETAALIAVAGDPGVGIAAGGGDDLVVLGDGSSILGSVDLGEDDDILTLIGTTGVTSGVVGGPGDDWIVLNGAGGLDTPLTQFESLTKDGLGTFTLPQLGPVDHIEINAGMLHAGETYQLGEDGLLHLHVNSDGTSSLLHTDQTLTVDGTLEVVRDPGLYRFGMTYDVITSGRIDGVFGDVLLPEPRPLLSFVMNQQDDRCQVVVETRSFTLMTDSRMERSMAGYLDTLMPVATGDVAEMMASVQAYRTHAEFHDAFMSLSPHVYSANAVAAVETLRRSAGVVKQRMSGVRSGMLAASYDGGHPDRILLAFDGSQESLGRLFDDDTARGAGARLSAWVNGSGQWGDQEGEGGFPGFKYDANGVSLGLDYILDDNIIVGASLDYTEAEVDLDQNVGDGEIEGLGGSVYGTYFTDRYYMEGGAGYARQEYDNRRRLTSPMTAVAVSDHEGDAYSLYGEAGYHVPVRDFVITPFGGMHYIRINEAGFTEHGAGGLSLSVDDRTTDSLRSELGARASRTFPVASGTFLPTVNIAWVHDYRIDDQDIRAGFVGAPGTSFAVRGQEVDTDGAVLGAGLTFEHTSGVQATLRYDAEVRSDFDSHMVFGEIRVPF